MHSCNVRPRLGCKLVLLVVVVRLRLTQRCQIHGKVLYKGKYRFQGDLHVNHFAVSIESLVQQTAVNLFVSYTLSV